MVKTIDQKKPATRSRRGSVIILVVAVLGLLAVIGTVFVVTARTERSSADGINAALNIDLAQRAAEEVVLRVMHESMMDANGTIGGFAGSGERLWNGRTGSHAARRFDMPEVNPWALPNPGLSGPRINGAFSALHNSAVRDQAWLATGIYRPKSAYALPSLPGPVFDPFYGQYPKGADTRPIDQRFQSLSMLTRALFNPRTGKYDIPYFRNPQLDPMFTSRDMFSVVADPSLPPPQLPIPFDPHQKTSADADAYIQLLPIADPQGVRFRFGVRIVDTSGMANLNVGMISALLSEGSNQHGTYYNGYALDADHLFPPDDNIPPLLRDVPENLIGMASWDNPGRAGIWSGNSVMPPEFAWQTAVMRFENPSLVLTSPFDLADELELRTYGVLGTRAATRLASGIDYAGRTNDHSAADERRIIAGTGRVLWPNTLGNRRPGDQATLLHNLSRGNYTTYSYSSQFRPRGVPAHSDLINYTAQGSGYWNIDDGTVRPFYRVTTWKPFVDAPDYGYSLGMPIGDVMIHPLMPGQFQYAAFPAYPSPVAANPDVSLYTGLTDQQAAERLVVAATNLAVVFEHDGAGFKSPNEARAFAVNYLTYIWNGWEKTTSHAGSCPTDIYRLIAGPSFVDNEGICLRAVSPTTGKVIKMECGSWQDLRTYTPGRIFLGYAAQPYINEVAVRLASDTAAGQTSTAIKDWAIELYNPYNVALSLKGYKLRLEEEDIPLSPEGLEDSYVPARGYFVLCLEDGELAKKVHPEAFRLTAKASMNGVKNIYLMRPYMPRGSEELEKHGAVDHFDISKLAETKIEPPQTEAPATQAANDANPSTRPNPDEEKEASHIYCQFRANGDSNSADPDLLDRWQAVYAASESLEVKPEKDMSLGTLNPRSDPGLPCVPLYDRYTEAGAPAQRTLLRNIAEFARIMRIANEFNVINGNGKPDGDGTVAAQMEQRRQAIAKTREVIDTEFPMDAMIHLDFRALPAWYGDPNDAPRVHKPGDPRAASMLEWITFVDRVSDFSLSLDTREQSNGDDVFDTMSRSTTRLYGMDKLRIPGRINVNTASAEVLAAIPELRRNHSLIGMLLAYRWRTRTDDPRIPPWAQGRYISDFSDPLQFPGYGIRSLAELELILAEPNAKTLDQRYQVWARLFNTLTVRSDTFVAYFYIEAVKLNPRYDGTAFRHLTRGVDNEFDNSTDWYLNSPDAITNDPRNSSAPLLRVASRRWICLIDRGVQLNQRAVQRSSQEQIPLGEIVARRELPR